MAYLSDRLKDAGLGAADKQTLCVKCGHAESTKKPGCCERWACCCSCVFPEAPESSQEVQGDAEKDPSLSTSTAAKDSSESAERIRSAAVRKDGVIYPCFAHTYHEITRLNLDAPEDVMKFSAQGFITTSGRFVNRYEALEIARAAGQIVHEHGPVHGLFSEDLRGGADLVSRTSPAEQWQPIHTAPLNESVLVFIPNCEHYGEGIYRGLQVESRGIYRGWQITGLHMGRDCGPDYQPTHWMPLPAPPLPGDTAPKEKNHGK